MSLDQSISQMIFTPDPNIGGITVTIHDLIAMFEEQQYSLKNNPYSEQALREGLIVLREIRDAITKIEPSHVLGQEDDAPFFPMSAYKKPSKAWRVKFTKEELLKLEEFKEQE